MRDEEFPGTRSILLGLCWCCGDSKEQSVSALGGVSAFIGGWKPIFRAGVSAWPWWGGSEVVWVLCVIISALTRSDLIVAVTLCFLLPVLWFEVITANYVA